MPEAQNDSKNKLAAVLIMFYGTKPTIIMTERPKNMNHHAGEISFPGGTWQEDDRDLLDTAIRETKEELGIEISRNAIIGQLQPVTTLNSGFTITAFIAFLDDIPSLVPNSEIESVLKIPLLELLKTMKDDTDPDHKSIQEMYTFRFQDYLIWGASARMLKQIFTKLSVVGLV
ncbi:MAG: CoA pyrophosphatase [Thaumarchaeota archaeon]|nr:MAG: CoA pyrophosphatase [Nitrososphaerota archaeon]